MQKVRNYMKSGMDSFHICIYGKNKNLQEIDKKKLRRGRINFLATSIITLCAYISFGYLAIIYNVIWLQYTIEIIFVLDILSNVICICGAVIINRLAHKAKKIQNKMQKF